MHVSYATATSRDGFGSAVHSLVDRAACFCGETAPSGLHSQVECVCRECNNLEQKLSSAHNKITRLSQGINIPIPTTAHDKGGQLEQARLALLGMPMKIDWLEAGPSHVSPMSLFSMGRVQAEPAALVPPTKYPLSSLPQDIHNVEPVTGPSAFETIQGTLFPEFTGQEYPKNTSILGEGIDGKGDRTLFGCMGDYVYAYQKDAIKYACNFIQGGRSLPASLYQSLNAAVRFKDRIMGPICLYNSVEELRTIFKASHSKEEGRAPSYCQASDIITFLNHWRKHKNLEVSKLMRAAMKAWKPPVWATDKAKKKKEFLRGEEKRKRETKSGVPPPPILIQVLQERITSEPIQSPLGGSNTTPGTVTPIPLLTRVNEQLVPDTTPASHVLAETTTRPQRKILLNFKTTFLPREAPTLTASIDDWSKFIK
ncbi:hypothetical protein OG21DRAFT_1491165 [Imleria badia]|nr:hypothetical protein OG21DRAFT_1491165 [Imleria badia]